MGLIPTQAVTAEGCACGDETSWTFRVQGQQRQLGGPDWAAFFLTIFPQVFQPLSSTSISSFQYIPIMFNLARVVFVVCNPEHR